MLNGTNLDTKITNILGDTAGQYTTANRVIDLNIWQNNIVGIILDSQDESDYDDPNQTDYPIITTPLVANQRDYPIPFSKSLLEIKRTDVCYDGVTPYRATAIDSSEFQFGIGNDSQTDSYFSKTSPGVDVRGLSLFLYPRADATDVTNGGYIRTEYSRLPIQITSANLASATWYPGFDGNFHAMLAYGAAYEYACSNSLAIKDDIKAKLDEYEARLRRQYGRKQKDRLLTLNSRYSDTDFT
jgi:hypothetical protein